MYFVNEIHLAVSLAKLILSIHENEALLGCNLLSALEESACVVFHYLIILFAHNALGYDFIFGYVHVVTLICLCSRSNDWLWETLVLLHAIWQFHAAYLPASFLVISPCRTRTDGTYDHLHPESLAFEAHCNHWVWRCNFPVGTDIGSSI